MASGTPDIGTTPAGAMAPSSPITPTRLDALTYRTSGVGAAPLDVMAQRTADGGVIPTDAMASRLPNPVAIRFRRIAAFRVVQTSRPSAYGDPRRAHHART